MTTQKHEPSVARKALAEFRSVEDGLKSLQERTERLIQGAAEEIPTLRSETLAISGHLKSYLRFEEEGQLFECLLDRLPEKAADIEELRDEHGSLGQVVDRLVQAAHDLSVQSAAAFGEEVLAFIEAFHRHEDRETRLYQRACVRDEGSKD